MTVARVMLAGGAGDGEGRLVRRPAVILFDPTGDNQDLATRFDDASTDSEALDSVKKHLIESGFAAAPVVVVSWDQESLDLLIFGDVALHSSAIAAPMVSGAGSASWVERHVGELERGSEPTLELWSGDAADPTTNLGLGVVACAGFRLSLEFASSDASQAAGARPAAAAGTPPAAASAVPAQSVAPPAPPLEEAVPIEDPPPVERAEPTPAMVPPSESVEAPPAPLVGPAKVGEMAEMVEEDSTVGDIRDGEPQDPFSAQAGDAPARVGLIEAAHCQDGHANPPLSAACYRCGISLIDDQSLSLIDQPTVGRIVFPGGQGVPLDRDLELGRKPSPASGVHPVIIDHAEVSRSHAALTVEGWTVLLTDLGSRNGTWVVPPNDVTPVRLDSEVSHVLEHGSRVHVGGPEVAFTYLFDAEDE